MTEQEENSEINPGRGRKKGRLLIFIVAYNAERTIESVLKRIPVSLSDSYEVEVLIIDDSSQDETFFRSETIRRAGVIPFTMTVLFNPVNQGYGGNQKIGFHYAIKNDFDWVALVHGDGQYAPECLPELVGSLAKGEADAVFGSRMMEGYAALKGGMPFYKFVGNKILTRYQNLLLRTNLSEFHSGYRLYSTQALAKIPFELNSNDFHFDTEIIIQLVFAGQKIRELPIPTFYGEEICHVNGLKYAWDVFLTTLHARVQKYHIFYDRKFDCIPDQSDGSQSWEQFSAESLIMGDIRQNSRIYVLGDPSSHFLSALREMGHSVTVERRGILQSDLQDCKDIDYLVMIDDTDLAQQPERLVEKLRELCRLHPDVQIVMAVGNIGFIVTRLLLLFGRFSYTRKGILSLRHFRLFTLRTLKKLFSQNGFDCEKTLGVPIPYNQFIASKRIAPVLAKIHLACIRLRPSLFSYQLLIYVKPKYSLEYLLAKAIRVSRERQSEIGEGAAPDEPIQQ